jgi:hypothetical protein
MTLLISLDLTVYQFCIKNMKIIRLISYHSMHIQCLEQLKHVCVVNFFLLVFNNLFLFNIDAIPAEPDMEKVRKGKLFKEEYNLLSYKIIFQLALKQDNVIYISNITCETETINERKFSRLKY